MAQIAPIKAMIVRDVDGDGNLDLIWCGNLYDRRAEHACARMRGMDCGSGVMATATSPPRVTARKWLLAPLNVTGLALYKTPTGIGLVDRQRR